MICTVSFTLNNELLSLELDAADYLNGLHINCHPLKKKGHITEVTVGENIVIIKQDAYYEGEDNINAYDWKGNHLWNIAEIVGGKRKYSGGFMSSLQTWQNASGFDLTKYKMGHSLYTCISEGFAFVIDLEDKKVVQIFPNQR